MTDVYADLLYAWQRRMDLLAAGDRDDAAAVWAGAYWKHFPRDERMIEWRHRDDGGTDCIVAGVMYFEATVRNDGQPLVRVPK